MRFAGIVSFVFLSMVSSSSADSMFRMDMSAPILFTQGASGGEKMPMSASLATPFPASPIFLGTAFLSRIEPAGGVPPYFYEVSEGVLPEGLALLTDGSIDGNFLSEASPFTLTVRDSAEPPARVDFDVAPIVYGPISISADVNAYKAVANAATTTYASLSLPVGGLPPYVHSLDPVPPAGTLSIDSATGVVSWGALDAIVHGPYRQVVTDAAGQTVLGDTLTVDATSSGMRLSFPNGASVIFKGWTAAPANVTTATITTSSWMTFKVGKGTCSVNIAIQPTDVPGGFVSNGGTTMPPGSACRAEYEAKGFNQTFLDWSGQSVPVELGSIVRTTPSSTLNYSAAQLTWTSVAP